MSACCPLPPANETLGGMRRALWIVLAINAAMFVIEILAGFGAESVALQADALDFLGDSANYAIALFVLGRSVKWRAGSALVKGVAMLVFGIFVLATSIHGAATETAPEAAVMGGIGFLALTANVISALVLFSFRNGDSNLRAVWLCSRNDAIGNLAVIAAASGVFASGSAWPDLAVGGVMAALALWAGQSVIRQARGELRRPSMAAAE